MKPGAEAFCWGAAFGNLWRETTFAFPKIDRNIGSFGHSLARTSLGAARLGQNIHNTGQNFLNESERIPSCCPSLDRLIFRGIVNVLQRTPS